MKTKVVNIKKTVCEVYCGRGSIYGNPFRIGEDGDRKQVIEKYRKYFYKRLTDAKFRDSILSLKGKILGCYCKPLACHVDVIIEYLEKEPVWGIEKVYDGCMGGVNLEEW